MMVLTIRPATDGAVFARGGLLPVSRTVTATTIASDTSHPKMNVAPFRTPPCDANTRMNAVKGIGSRVIANPMRTRLRTSTRHELPGRNRRRLEYSHTRGSNTQHGNINHPTEPPKAGGRSLTTHPIRVTLLGNSISFDAHHELIGSRYWMYRIEGGN